MMKYLVSTYVFVKVTMYDMAFVSSDCSGSRVEGKGVRFGRMYCKMVSNLGGFGNA